MATKMTTLEAIGLLILFLTIPKKLAGKHIILGVNNLGVVFGWQSRGVKNDLWASVLLRALHMVAAFLSCQVYVQHVPRLSSSASMMADSLTRSSTATAEVWAMATGAETHEETAALWDWLAHPKEDWMLGFQLVKVLRNTM
jgi:hypothetical protein